LIVLTRNYRLSEKIEQHTASEFGNFCRDVVWEPGVLLIQIADSFAFAVLFQP
jgi:hypothetical protein